jgi:two-component system C4-dicarboxylate transport sensor histidine kinase DctB
VPSRIADLRVVIDETRIIMEPGLNEAGIETEWPIARDLPLVRADQQGLVQILINLLRNSQRALANGQAKRIRISSEPEAVRVLLRVADSGPGVADADRLFTVFQPGADTGLGLYISRSVALSFGGDLRYEESAGGACFTVELKRAEARG